MPNALRRAAVLAALLLVSVAPSSAQIVANGSFELGPVIPQANPIFEVPAGSSALTGWTVTGGAVSIITDNYWDPRSGHRSLALSSDAGPGAIQQSFNTSPGSFYRLIFYLSGEPFSSPTIKHLRVTTGVTVREFTYDVTPGWHWDMHWRIQAIEFEAFAISTLLRFESLDASPWGPAIDSVKVELVTADVPQSHVLSLSAMAPDPLAGSGRVTFSLASPGRARLAVYDVQGRELARLADGENAAGPHTIEFSPSAWGVRPGLCIAVLHAGGHTLVRRFTVLQ